MLLDFRNGQTSVVLRVKLRNSSVATGAGLTGLTSASTGLVISTIADNESTATSYTVAGSTVETITTLGTYAAPTATKCRFREVDATHHPGIYELQIADARFAVSSAKSLLVSLSGATNLAECDVVVPLRSVNPYDSVRFGMTALPNAAAESASGLLTYGNGIGQLNPTSGKMPATLTAADVSGNVAADLQTVKGQAVTCSAGVTVGAFVGNATAALAVDASGRVDVGKILGTASAGTAGYVGIDWSHVNAPTTAVNLSGTTISTGQAVASVSGAVGSVTGNVGGSVGSVTAAVTVGGYSAGEDPATLVLDATASSHNTAGTIGAAINGASAPSAGTVAAAVWDLATSGHTTAGTFGAAMVNASAPTASTVAAAVWDLSTTGHTTSGTFGAAMNAAGSAGDPWATSLPGAYGAGTAGKIVGTYLDAAVSSRSTYAGADTSGTTTLLSRIGGALTISGGKVAATLASTDVTGNVAADLQTIKTQSVTCAAGVTVLASVGTAATSTAQTGDAYARLGAPAGASVSADVAAVKTDTAAIKTKTDALPTWPTNFASLAITAGGAVTAGTVSDKTGYSLTQSFPANFASMAITSGGLVSVNTAQALTAARNVGAVADTSLTLNDALHCAIAAAAGQETVSGTTYTVKTPSTATTLRTFTLDSGTSPTSRT